MAKKQEKTIEQRLEETLVLYEKTPYNLPSNWCWVRLGTVCKLNNGERSDKEELFYLDAKTLRHQNYERTQNNGVIVEEGQRVILVDGENSGEVFDIPKRGYMGSTFRILDIDKTLNDAYVSFFISSHQDELRNNKVGSAIPHLNKELFFNLFFPLAPLEEQRRIVDAIAKQSAKLDEAKDLIQKSLDSFAERKSNILHKAFSGELTKLWRENRESESLPWRQTTLDQIAKWGSGGTPSRKRAEYYKGNIPWVKTGELNNSYIFDTEEKISDKAVKESSAKLYPIGTVVVAMYGATIGQCAILGIEATTNQACACAVVKEEIINNKFLFYYLVSQKNKFIAFGKGGAQPNISQSIIKAYPISVPNIKEQEEIVRILDSIFEKEDKSKELIDMLDKIDEMKQSILARAFRGDLGTSNPADEPAIDLLRKILENQVSVVDKKKNTKRKTSTEFPFSPQLNRRRLKICELLIQNNRLSTDKLAQGVSRNISFLQVKVNDKKKNTKRKTNTGFPISPQLNRRQLKICELLIQNDGLSINKLAQEIGRDVSYLFDDLGELTEKRMIKFVDNRYWINADN